MNQQIGFQTPKFFKFQIDNAISPSKNQISKGDTNIKANKVNKKVLFKFQILHKPGIYLTDSEITKLVHDIRSVAATAFNPIPEYQAMVGTREELSDKIIALAWDNTTLAGFSSLVELYVPTIGNILHLGLTVVRPEYRSNGLTHILMQKAITSYIFKNAIYFNKVWITNCAAVLSSLVNVALHFEQVYPSPKNITYTPQHRIIAETINLFYRRKLYIREDSYFDSTTHVFKGSIKNTVFQKEAHDTSHYHRNKEYNDFYKNVIDFTNGDEVLQIGYASIPAAIRHALFNKLKKFILLINH